MCPCCVEEYINREYVAVRNLNIPKGISVEVDVDRIDVINIISLNRLIDGGAAMFAHTNKNHHIEITGVAVSIPLVKVILRVLVISYEMFASTNRADEHKPWAIIIISAPESPHLVFVDIPANIIPIWPTEE